MSSLRDNRNKAMIVARDLKQRRLWNIGGGERQYGQLTIRSQSGSLCLRCACQQQHAVDWLTSVPMDPLTQSTALAPHSFIRSPTLFVSTILVCCGARWGERRRARLTGCCETENLAQANVGITPILTISTRGIL
jgi:hypothetical protein